MQVGQPSDMRVKELALPLLATALGELVGAVLESPPWWCRHVAGKWEEMASLLGSRALSQPTPTSASSMNSWSM